MQRFLARTCAAIMAGALCSAPAEAAPARCDISAYLLNSDAAGTNIRSAPSSRSSILKTIPSDYETVAAITGFDNGWFLIDRLESTGGEVDELLFNGPGWIHRSQLHLDVAGGHQELRAAPSPKARVTGRAHGDQPDVKLLSCSGGWAEIMTGEGVGWLARAGQCSNPLTTCP